MRQGSGQLRLNFYIAPPADGAREREREREREIDARFGYGRLTDGKCDHRLVGVGAEVEVLDDRPDGVVGVAGDARRRHVPPFLLVALHLRLRWVVLGGFCVCVRVCVLSCAT